MRSVSKIFTKTTIKASKIDVVNGEVTTTALPDVETFEKVADEKTAVRLFKKSKKTSELDHIVITAITTKDYKYTMSAEDFMKYSSSVQPVDSKE